MLWDILKNSILPTWILQSAKASLDDRTLIWMWFNVASCLVEHTLCFYPSFFTQMISDRTTWRRYVQFTYWWELVVHWVRPFFTLIFVFAPSDEDIDNCMLFFHQPFLIFVDSWLTSWGSLEMQLKFLLDCLTAWRRVVLLCLLMIRQPSWWSKKEPHWYL